jgi:CBS domain-containing protein
LYEAQVPTHGDSPVHRASGSVEALGRLRVAKILEERGRIRTFGPATASDEMHRAVSEATWQITFPVVDASETVIGVVSGASIGTIALLDGGRAPIVASDLMQLLIFIRAPDDLRTAAEHLLESGLHQLPVISPEGALVGLLDESAITRAYLSTVTPGPGSSVPGGEST